MRLLCLLALLFAATLPPLRAQSLPAADQQGIRAMLQQQTVDWNKGDIDSFAKGYKNSPGILFMGTKIYHGYDAMLQRYKTAYAGRAKMGTLSYSQLEIQPLSDRFATVTGHFHLERTSAGGNNADGYFMLVVEKTPAGWKIVRDDTTALPKTPAE